MTKAQKEMNGVANSKGKDLTQAGTITVLIEEEEFLTRKKSRIATSTEPKALQCGGHDNGVVHAEITVW